VKSKLALLLILANVSVAAIWAQSPSASTSANESRADTMLKQLSLEEKIDLIGGVDGFYIREIKHVGLPRLKMADGPFGVRNYGPSTTFGGIGLAATWDPELAGRMGAIIGQDARARGVHFMLGPGWEAGCPGCSFPEHPQEKHGKYPRADKAGIFLDIGKPARAANSQ